MDDIKKLKDEFGRLKKEICKISYFKKGSITKCFQTCGTKSCRCHKDDKYKHGPYFWWTWKEKNKSKSILVPESMVEEALAYIENYKKLKEIIENLEEISKKIFKIRVSDYKTKNKSQNKKI